MDPVEVVADATDFTREFLNFLGPHFHRTFTDGVRGQTVDPQVSPPATRQSPPVSPPPSSN